MKMRRKQVEELNNKYSKIVEENDECIHKFLMEFLHLVMARQKLYGKITSIDMYMHSYESNDFKKCDEYIQDKMIHQLYFIDRIIDAFSLEIKLYTKEVQRDDKRTDN